MPGQPTRSPFPVPGHHSFPGQHQMPTGARTQPGSGPTSRPQYDKSKVVTKPIYPFPAPRQPYPGHQHPHQGYPQPTPLPSFPTAPGGHHQTHPFQHYPKPGQQLPTPFQMPTHQTAAIPTTPYGGGLGAWTRPNQHQQRSTTAAAPRHNQPTYYPGQPQHPGVPDPHFSVTVQPAFPAYPGPVNPQQPYPGYILPPITFPDPNAPRTHPKNLPPASTTHPTPGYHPNMLPVTTPKPPFPGFPGHKAPHPAYPGAAVPALPHHKQQAPGTDAGGIPHNAGQQYPKYLPPPPQHSDTVQVSCDSLLTSQSSGTHRVIAVGYIE